MASRRYGSCIIFDHNEIIGIRTTIRSLSSLFKKHKLQINLLFETDLFKASARLENLIKYSHLR